MSFLFVNEDREYLLAPGETLESDLGILEVPEDVTAGDTVETHLGTEFTARRLRGPDLFHHFERTGAPMMPRDVGLLCGHIGVSDADRILDAGTGTGVLAAYLGRAGADVVTYEVDPHFATIARENMRLAGVSDRVSVRTGDVIAALQEVDGGPATDSSVNTASEQVEELEKKEKEEKEEKEQDRKQKEGKETLSAATFDAITLDTEDAPTVVARAPALLRPGGALAVYSPFVEATREVVETARDVGLTEIRTLETIQREMDFDDRGSRPSTGGVGHTGYLTFARRP